MSRQRREFSRPKPFRDARLIVIAAEGVKTEKEYFQSMIEDINSTRIKPIFLDRDDPTKSSPDEVLATLDRYCDDNDIEENDQKWLVIDRDPQSWKANAFSHICRLAIQRGHSLAVSNPCFEIWLLFHFEDISSFTNAQLEKICQNKNGYLKKYVGPKLKRKKHKLNWKLLRTRILSAIQRAEKMDTTRSRWPSAPGSHVYKLVRELHQHLL